jgi:hypothetical protein
LEAKKITDEEPKKETSFKVLDKRATGNDIVEFWISEMKKTVDAEKAAKGDGEKGER